jgi:uncharacterized protein
LTGVHPTDDLKRLTEWFLSNGDKTVVALSGGVDSAVLALAAKRAFGNNALSVTANYKTLSYQELSAARKVAKEIGIRHKVINYSELESSDFVKNDQLRCYHCRKELGLRLINEANKFKTNLVVDGTNLDDLKEYRPGITGLKENGVRSPFLELGIDKSIVRAIAQHFGLSVYDKPSNACLASRIPHGTPVTYEKLRRIEKSEIIVMKVFNIRQVRVRDHGDIARIEVGKEELTKLFDVDKLAIIDCRLKELGFKFVAIDAGGYRSGGLVVLS